MTSGQTASTITAERSVVRCSDDLRCGPVRGQHDRTAIRHLRDVDHEDHAGIVRRPTRRKRCGRSRGSSTRVARRHCTIQVSALMAISTPAQNPRGSASRTLVSGMTRIARCDRHLTRPSMTGAGARGFTLQALDVATRPFSRSYPTLPQRPQQASAWATSWLTINGIRAFNDVIEYQQLVDDEPIPSPGAAHRDQVLRARRRPSTRAAGEPLGLRLNSSIFDRVQTCDNHCDVLLHLSAAAGDAEVALPEGRRLPPLVPVRQLHDTHSLHGARPRPCGRGEARAALRVDPHDRSRCASRDAPQPKRGGTQPALASGASSSHDITVHGQDRVVPRGQRRRAVLDRTLCRAAWPATRTVCASVGIVPLGRVPLQHGDRRWCASTPPRRPHRRDLDIIEASGRKSLDRSHRAPTCSLRLQTSSISMAGTRRSTV